MLSDQELGIPAGSSTVNTNMSPLGSRGGLRSGGHHGPGGDGYYSLIELRGPILDVGIFRDTLLPSLVLHTGLSLIAYGLGRATDRVEAKDWLWPSAQLVNAWWSAVGRKVVTRGVPLSKAFASLSRPERLILTGVTLWGGRLFYRIASRSLARKDASGKGQDDPRYKVMKKEEGFWNKVLLTQFLPEAVFQTIITLPFVAPFRHQGGVFTGYHPVLQAVAVGLFSAGLALEILADWQLENHKQTSKDGRLCKQGVWSIVRHPNYLGDTLLHFSFPLMLYSSDMLAPVELLGPIVNYLFLRYVSGDKQTEESQADRYTGNKEATFALYQNDPNVNSFWPDWQQFRNKWTWAVLGIGAAGAVVEHIYHQLRLD